jgi:TrmH family RNA methyltransferase
MLSKKIVKYIQSLSHKKLRDELSLFIAEGPKIISEFFKEGNFNCKLLCASGDWLKENKKILDNIPAVNVYEADDASLQKISQLKTPNKVVGVFEKKNPQVPSVLNNKLTLLLDDIQDPGNMGTIIRIADWFGIENIICGENCADNYNPKVVQASMGSLARVDVLYTNLPQVIESNKNISVYAAALAGISLHDLKNIEEGFILIGNESKGISNELLKMASKRITVPKYGNAESLNAAVATGIILSHLRSN